MVEAKLLTVQNRIRSFTSDFDDTATAKLTKMTREKPLIHEPIEEIKKYLTIDVVAVRALL